MANTGEATRTPDLRIMRPPRMTRQTAKYKANSSNQRSLALSVIHDSCKDDLGPDFATIRDAWADLTDDERAIMLMMAKSALKRRR
jgi:hypothetical protein